LLMWNGGMPPVLIKDAVTGKIKQTIASSNLPLGIETYSPDNYVLTSLEVNENDVIIAFSDGLVEMPNTEGELFGMERVIEIIERSETSEIKDTLLDEVDRFSSQDWRHIDDVTLVVIEV